MSQSRVEVRLLGGFRVSRDGRTVAGFESRKVRALFAYLGVHRGRAFSRDHLSDLLWPEEPPDSARRNLRQALYNLRRTLARDGAGAELLDVSNQSVRLAEGSAIWVDAEDFAFHFGQAASTAHLDPAQLAAAARLYEGDLLAGFHVDESPEFEEWCVTEQERLREGVLQALLRLMDHHLEAGTYSLGVEYGHRLVKLDPLSEAGHRRLMRLLAYAGRRHRAIAQYHELERILDDELGVEPQEETTAEFQAILTEQVPDRSIRQRATPVGPIVPLVGREDALIRLQRAWRAVTAGAGRTTRVIGESGVGKTRLIKSFLHEAASSRTALVLQGRHTRLAPAVAYQGIAQALGDALVHEVEVAEALVTNLEPEALSELQVLFPSLHDLRPGLPPAAAAGADRSRLFEAIAAALVALTHKPPGGDEPAGEGRLAGCRDLSCPVVLFLDDFEEADPCSRELFSFLRDRLTNEPIWLVAASSEPEEDSSVDETIVLDRLNPDAVARIANALVTQRAPDLSRILESGAGLPLGITELINLLWDEGWLVERGGSWRLEGSPSTEGMPDDLMAIFQSRLTHLPASTRRLFTLAAIAGPEFDADLLIRAEREHADVVETGLQVLLERWLARLRLGYWADSRQERDLTLWSAGPGRGSFEYSHPALRRIVYASLDRKRRAFLHGHVARVLEERPAPTAPTWRSETLAYHYVEAGDWERALPHLGEAAAHAVRLRSPSIAAHYFSLRLEAIAALGAPSLAATD